MIEPTLRYRLLSRRLLGCGILLLALFVARDASASPTPSAPVPVTAFAAQVPLVPPSFQLQGTNGYTISVVAIQPRAGLPGSVQIVARKGPMSVIYFAPASVTETSMEAHLGTLGEIAVSFHPSGRSTSSKCRGQKIEVMGGDYEGVIAFHGEEGYTEFEATSVPGDVSPLIAAACNFGFGSSGSPNPRSAELFIRNPALGPRFSVAKVGPASLAHFFVEVSAYTAGISIRRFASLAMPASSFRYSPNLQTATVHPQGPFSGAANFDRRERANRRWSGDLTIAMPGLSNAPLTGPRLRAGLVHAESTGRF